jgi:hypothetical protein
MTLYPNAAAVVDRVYRTLRKTVVRAGMLATSEKVGEIRKKQFVVVYSAPVPGPDGGVPRVQFDSVWTDAGPDLGKAGWTSTQASNGKAVLEVLSDEDRTRFVHASLQKLEDILGRVFGQKGNAIRQEVERQAVSRAASSWQRRVTGKIRLKLGAFSPRSPPSRPTSTSAPSSESLPEAEPEAEPEPEPEPEAEPEAEPIALPPSWGVHQAYTAIDFQALGTGLQELPRPADEADGGAPSTNELIRSLKQVVTSMEPSRQRLLAAAATLGAKQYSLSARDI